MIAVVIRRLSLVLIVLFCPLGCSFYRLGFKEALSQLGLYHWKMIHKVDALGLRQPQTSYSMRFVKVAIS